VQSTPGWVADGLGRRARPATVEGGALGLPVSRGDRTSSGCADRRSMAADVRSKDRLIAQLRPPISCPCVRARRRYPAGRFERGAADRWRFVGVSLRLSSRVGWWV